ncbi:hypothetical protein TrRE_jg3826 [Triparma retinervis]|uniref:Uncharacterized protein n=1 Tax=Triparma retinervis TaxID=2557542 RepID=A0A9W7AA61_9STRA|nr:hypothetical protein TrRE_jg3826 [Triparma retinervis]
MTLEEAFEAALVNKSMYEATKYKNLHTRVHVDYLHAIECEIFSSSRFRSAPNRNHTRKNTAKNTAKNAKNKMTYIKWRNNVERFLGECKRLKSLELPFWTKRVLEILEHLEGGGLATLRVEPTNRGPNNRINKEKQFDAEGSAMGKAMEASKDLKRLSWISDHNPVNLSLYETTLGRLVELNLSRFAGEIQLLKTGGGGVSRAKKLTWGGGENPDYPDCVSIYDFVDKFGMVNLEELNVSGTRFGDRCFKGTGGLVERLKGGTGTSTRDWNNTELRVKACLTTDCGTGRVSVRCGACHSVLVSGVKSFLLSPEFTPETGEVTVMHFDGEFGREGLMRNEDGAWVCGNGHGSEVKT